MSEPIWIRDDVLLAIHRRQLAEHSGGDGVRDTDLLDATLNKPKNLYPYSNEEPGLVELAASYAFGIARNHPFIDGNKRTAFVVCRLFLKLNGKNLMASQEEKYNIFMKLAAGNLSEQELASWITCHLL